MIKMEHCRKATLAGSVALAALAAPGLATAQEATTLDDVVVTAQRREQSLQEVPITVSVVTAKTLESLAADDMGDISAFVPGLSVSNTSPTQAKYSIRGVSTSDFGVGTDPAVGVYVDGVYAARSGAGLLAFSDVARIEVLKGRKAPCSAATAPPAPCPSPPTSPATNSKPASASGWANTTSAASRVWSTCRSTTPWSCG